VDVGKISVTATSDDAKPVQLEAPELKSVSNTAFGEMKEPPKELAVDLGDGVKLEMVLIPLVPSR
jgi:hypothetical protein